MDRIDAMRVFTRIVECRSFTRAADDLGLPRSSATEAVQALEARLGVRLLQRTTRHVSATLDGQAYYQQCLRLLADIEEAENAFASVKPRGLLHVNVHGKLASHFMMPYLPEFLQTYPDITLQISESDRFIDLLQEGVDCVVRVGKLADSDLIAKQLTTLTETTCASPGYIQRHGIPQHIDALAGHQMVAYRSSTGGVLPLAFIEHNTTRHVMLPYTVSVNGAETYAAAARAGFGLIQAPAYGMKEDIQQGRLVAVLAAWDPEPMPVSVLYPRSRHLSPRLRIFIDWLTKRFATST